MSVKIDLEDVADWLVMLSSIDGQISPREERHSRPPAGAPRRDGPKESAGGRKGSAAC